MSSQGAVRRLLDAWRDRGWNVPPRIAAEIVTAESVARAAGEVVGPVVPVADLRRIGVPPDAFAALNAEVLSSLVIEPPQDVLVPIEEIESFAAARKVEPAAVTAILPEIANLREEHVKRFLADVLALPSVPKDWGGENDDIYSTHVRLAGRQVAGSFALKGRSVPGRMRIRDMGKNGDQLVRLASQPVDLFVVQHVNEIDSSVRKSLQNEVLAIRASRNARAVGSVWDGTDTARLLTAHGYVDPSDGAITGRGEQLLK